MMENRTVTCIVCPVGCVIEARETEGGLAFSGNRCPRGAAYARDEVTAPKRIVTTTAAVTGAGVPLVAVRSAGAVPKELQRAVVREIAARRFAAPVRRGDVLIRDVLGTGADIVATADALE